MNLDAVAVEEKLDWETIWENRQYSLKLERAQYRFKDQERTMHRFFSGSSGEGRVGAVCICTRPGHDGEPEFLFTRQKRLAPGVILVELPRGGWENGDDCAEQTAAREVREETGYVIAQPQMLGMIYPDSGILASQVAVVYANLAVSQPVSDGDGEAAEVMWLTRAQIRDLIHRGEIRDAITLAALGMRDSATFCESRKPHES